MSEEEEALDRLYAMVDDNAYHFLGHTAEGDRELIKEALWRLYNLMD
jgi:hypothetical protein